MTFLRTPYSLIWPILLLALVGMMGVSGIAQTTNERLTYPEAERIPTRVFANLFTGEDGIALQRPEFSGLWISRQINIPLASDSIAEFFTFVPRLRMINYSPERISVSVQFYGAEGAIGDLEVIPYADHFELEDTVFLGQMVYAPAAARSFELFVAFTETSPGQRLAVLKGVEVSFFAPQTAQEPLLRSNQVIGANSSCNCPIPSFVTRTGWNCPTGQAYSFGSPSYAAVTHQVVHHSAGSNSVTDWPAVVLAIWRFHTEDRGWDDIGYNWLIDPNGNIYEGRGGGNNVVGAHFCGKNTHTMGICLLGSFENTAPTIQAINALEQLLTWKSCDADILDPTDSAILGSTGQSLPHILGHRDGSVFSCNTLCPGAMAFGMLPNIRTEVKASLEACTNVTSIDPQETTLGLTIYPNPTHEALNIEWEGAFGKQLQMKLVDLSGRVLLNHEVPFSTGAGSHRWNVSYLTPGLYHLQLTDGFHRLSKKVVIR